jgi:hypothetical protein
MNDTLNINCYDTCSTADSSVADYQEGDTDIAGERNGTSAAVYTGRNNNASKNATDSMDEDRDDENEDDECPFHHDIFNEDTYRQENTPSYYKRPYKLYGIPCSSCGKFVKVERGYGAWHCLGMELQHVHCRFAYCHSCFSQKAEEGPAHKRQRKKKSREEV